MRRIDLTAGPRRGRFIAVWVGGWAVYILLKALIIAVQSRVPLGRSLAYALSDHLPLALISIALFHVTKHRSSLRGAALVATHIALAVVAIGVAKAGYFLILFASAPPAIVKEVIDESWMYQVLTTTLEYGALLGIILALQARRRERESEALTREAELAAARAQLHPHFMLNSLNSVVSLIDTDPRGAREMVVRLSELLQASFRRLDDELVPLDSEIEMARAYLAIEQIRFGPRLRVAIDVADDARAVEVPPLLLQPLVENAVRHGIAPLPRGGEVRVTARRGGNDRLLLEVHDSGAGAVDESLLDGGRGLLLTRRRLENVYPSGYSMSFDRSAGGFAVRLDLPVHD
jgi:signal transduction histidine kinase